MFQELMDIYFAWHVNEIGYKPKIDGGDGKGLKELITYLKTLDDDVVGTFKYILEHWDEVDEFYRKQTRLRQINGNIHNIIYIFKNGQATKKKYGVSEEYLRRLTEGMW